MGGKREPDRPGAACHNYPATFVLQQNTDLNTTNWVAVGVVPNDDGTNKSVVVSLAAGSLYFRLKSP